MWDVHRRRFITQEPSPANRDDVEMNTFTGSNSTVNTIGVESSIVDDEAIFPL